MVALSQLGTQSASPNLPEVDIDHSSSLKEPTAVNVQQRVDFRGIRERSHGAPSCEPPLHMRHEKVRARTTRGRIRFSAPSSRCPQTSECCRRWPRWPWHEQDLWGSNLDSPRCGGIDPTGRAHHRHLIQNREENQNPSNFDDCGPIPIPGQRLSSLRESPATDSSGGATDGTSSDPYRLQATAWVTYSREDLH